jgi:hypothetical protein
VNLGDAEAARAGTEQEVLADKAGPADKPRPADNSTEDDE